MAAISRIMKHELRIMVFVISMILASLFIIHPVYAQTTNYLPADATHQALQAGQLPTTVSPTSPLYTDLLVNNLFHSFSCLAIGQSIISQPCLTYLQGVPVLSKVNTSGGVLGSTTNLIGMLYQNPPVRTADYLASVGQGLGLVKTANAQVTGSGAAVLNPILSLWKTSRNISYVLMIIIFLVIGLMVMFRNKINPQTVITAQAALPGLVIGLIMITFSYFLAGLISDMAFVGTNVVGYYFQAAQGNGSQDLVAAVSNKSILSVFSNLIPDGSMPWDTNSNGNFIEHALATVMDNVSPGVANFLRFAAGVMVFQQANMIGHVVPVVGDLVGIITGVIASGVAAADVPAVGGLLLSWVAIAVLIYSMIKLLFNLIKTYLTIIFLTITAPFQLLAAALPGRQGIATGWMLSMLANALVFPAVLAVLYFVAFLLNRNGLPFVISGQAIVSSKSTFPLLGGLDSRFINYLLAFAALVFLPAIPEVINRTIGKASAAGQLLGQELSGNLRGGQGYSNQWNQLGQAGQKIGQDVNTFRGRPPGWSPAMEAKNLGGWRGGLENISIRGHQPLKSRV